VFLIGFCIWTASAETAERETQRADLLSQAPNIAEGAAWELRMLGVDTPEKLQELRKISNRRPVTLAVIGTGGVSKSVLAAKLGEKVTVEYRMGPNFPNCDPNSNTHDTQMVRVISEITNAIRIKLKVLVYQPSEVRSELAEAFSSAGQTADIICFYQSYWDNIDPILESLRNAGKSLIISPYVAVGDRRTNRTPQGYAHKPWSESIDHFVTVAPLARKSNGGLTGVSDRDSNDTEIINFVAPSYYANGPGGTCPSAAVAVSVACYLYASNETPPRPSEIISIMRETSVIDGKLIASMPPFSQETAVNFKNAVHKYTRPEPSRRRRLDAPGLLNLYRAYLQIREGKE